MNTRESERKVMKASKEEKQALYTSFDIHRRVMVLAAMWTAFDPFGAAVHVLRDLESDAWNLREAVEHLKPYWNYTEQPNHPLHKIKEGKDEYGTFRNHIKGIEGALRRLSRNPYIITWNFGNHGLAAAYKNFEVTLSDVRNSI